MVYGSCLCAAKQDFIEKLLLFSVKCGNENYNKMRTICTEKAKCKKMLIFGKAKKVQSVYCVEG